MKKRILFLSLTVSLCALVLMTFFSTFIYRQNLVDTTVDHLSVYMLSYRQNRDKFDALIASGKGAEAARLLSEEVGGNRITLIDFFGEVLADSHKEELSENHLERKEVETALTKGTGYSVRSSKSIGREMIYYCEKFADPNILVRVSVASSSVWDVLKDMLPLLTVFLLLDVAFCAALSAFAVRHVLRPVEEFGITARESKVLPLSAPYRELEPLAASLTRLKRDMASQVEEIRAEKMRESVVLENMDHGMVILRGVDEILLINKAAAQLLNFGESDKVLYAVARDKELLARVENRESDLLYRTWRRREYAVRTSYVSDMDAMVLLITDVTERRRAEKSKDEFIANVTHEMNTPLTAISGFAELIAGGALTKTQTKRDAQIIVEQSARLSALIKSILSYSTIESENIKDENFSLTELARAASADFAGAAEKKNVQLIFSGEGDVLINAKRPHVREVLDNFLSNAVRYNKPGGSVAVTVDVDPESNRPRLNVSDTGIGIAQENLTRVFDRFFTADRSHGGEGFGLGLAIVKKLSKSGGWQLSLNSTPDQGSSFTILF